MKYIKLLLILCLNCGYNCTSVAQDSFIDDQISAVEGSSLLLRKHTELVPGKTISIYYQLLNPDSSGVTDEKFSYIQHYSNDIFVVFHGEWKITVGKDAQQKMATYGIKGLKGRQDFLMAEHEGKCGLINAEGKLILPMDYTFISFYPNDFFPELKSRGFASKVCNGNVDFHYSSDTNSFPTYTFTSGSLQSCSVEDLKGAGSKKWHAKMVKRIKETSIELDQFGHIIP